MCLHSGSATLAPLSRTPSETELAYADCTRCLVFSTGDGPQSTADARGPGTAGHEHESDDEGEQEIEAEQRTSRLTLTGLPVHAIVAINARNSIV